MKMMDDNKDSLIAHRIGKSKKIVEEVDFLIAHGLIATSVNRIYYGMFHALSALAMRHDFAASKHGQLIGWFNKNFVKPKKVERSIGEHLRAAFNCRTSSDYDDWIEFSHEEVVALFEGMKAFVLEMERLSMPEPKESSGSS